MAGTELLRDDDAEVLQRLYCQYIYVTEGATGSIARVDAETGAITLLAGGLPPSIVGIGRAIDVAFIRGTAYVLVNAGGSDVGRSEAPLTSLDFRNRLIKVRSSIW